MTPADSTDVSSPPPAKSSPLLSVIVPVYRIPESFLRAHARSLRDQSFPDAEFLYVLDGPDPAALAVLRDVFRGDPRFLPAVLPENRGVSAARNAALDRARGSFFLFVDADDLLPPGTLAAYARAAEASPDLAVGPALGFVTSAANRLALFPPGPSDSGDLQWARFHVWANASACAKLYGPSLGTQRFSPGLHCLEDALFLWSCLSSLPSAFRLGFLSTLVYAVVHRPGSASRSPVSSADLSGYFDSLAALAKTPPPPGAGPMTRRIRAVQLLLWAFVHIHANHGAWADALPRARNFVSVFGKNYSIPFLLRFLVRRRLSSGAALASPTRLDDILIGAVYRWTTRTARGEPMFLSLLAIVCPPLYRLFVPVFHPLPTPSENAS